MSKIEVLGNCVSCPVILRCEDSMSTLESQLGSRLFFGRKAIRDQIALAKSARDARISRSDLENCSGPVTEKVDYSIGGLIIEHEYCGLVDLPGQLKNPQLEPEQIKIEEQE